jgi:DNA-binding Lrp family transcriptional regulator
LDEIDEKIISILKKDSRTPYIEIAKAVGLSEGAVRKRIQNLVKNEIIKRFSIEVTAKEGIKAVTLVSTTPSIPTPQVAEQIRAINGVEVVYEVTGQYDVAAVISGADIAAINKCIDEIRHINGIKDTNTLIVLKAWY